MSDPLSAAPDDAPGNTRPEEGSEHGNSAESSLSAAPGTTSSKDLAAAELPPVEPPSAAFIVQLFVIPALIVMIVVGAWLLFGKLASSKKDIQLLVQELSSGNPQREERAALELARLIRADRELGPDGEQLASNAEFAKILSDLLRESLKQTSPNKEELEQQAFLVRAVGWLDVNEHVLPVLIEALDARQQVDIRGAALGSVARIAGRMGEAGQSLTDEPTVEAVLESSRDENEFVRQTSAYTLALLDAPEATHRLEVMLQDSDEMTRVNSALGLARNKSDAGLSLFIRYYEQSLTELDQSALAQLSAEDRAMKIENKMRTEPIVLKNSFQAMLDLLPHLNDEQRAEVVTALSPVAEKYPNMAIQIEARKVLLAFNEQ